MRLITILLPALAALTEAATLHGCAGKCIGEAIASTGCSSADSPCVCSSESFLSSINECVPQTCSTDEQDAAITFAREFCQKIELAKRSEPAQSEAGQLERRSESSWTNLWGFMKRSPEAEAEPEEHQHSVWSWPSKLSLRAPPHRHRAAPYHVPWYQKRGWGSTISPPPATWYTVGTVNTVGTVAVYGRDAHWPPPGGPAKWGLNWRR